MATYYLDVDDEITSAAARIRNSPDDAVALVVSGASRVATSRINFRLLAREAKQHQRRLTIVAPEAEVRSLARSAGLPVYSTVGEYEAAEVARRKAGPDSPQDAVTDVLGQLAETMDGESGRAGRRRDGGGSSRTVASRGGSGAMGVLGSLLARIGLSGAVSIGLASLMVAGAGAATYLFLPATTITLTVKEEAIGPLALDVRIDPSIVTADDSVPVLPGLTKRFELRQSDTFTASGQKVIETPATGTVTFSSENTIQELSVPAGTQVWTADGTIFETTERVVVPKGIFSTSTPGTKAAKVQAVKAGEAGNVKAKTIVNLPPDYVALQLSVSNGNPTTGGSRTVKPLVVQADVERAKAALSTRLTLEFAARLQAPDVVPTGVVMFRETAMVDLAAVIFDPDPLAVVNQQVSSFSLAASASGSVTMADLSALRGLAERKITGSVRDGYALVEGSLTLEMGASTADGPAVTVPLTAAAAEAPKVDADELRGAVKGKSIEQARKYLSQYGTVEIKSWPGLWSSDVAGWDFRIDMRVVEPVSHAGSGPSATPVRSTGPSGAPSLTPTPASGPTDGG
jgi:hypothetical protein